MYTIARSHSSLLDSYSAIRLPSTQTRISSSHCERSDGSSYKECCVRALLCQSIISPSLSLVHYSVAFTQSLFSYTPFDTLASHNMQFIIFFASLIAATVALPIPQTGNTDVLSEATSGADTPLTGSSSDVLGGSGLPAGTELMERSPQIGVSILQRLSRTSLTFLIGWHWRCSIGSRRWHQQSDGRRCQQRAQQRRKLCIRSGELL